MHFFLWLLTQNKVLTRDDVAKRKHVEDNSYLFCCEEETTQHLFFECVFAKQIWRHLYDVLETNIGSDFTSIRKYWISNKKYEIVNIFSSAALGAMKT